MEIQGDCHCGSVKFTLRDKPKHLVACNCSICRRLGALWGHLPLDEVTIDASPEATIAYTWGDRSLAFHSCRQCGCTTHWENLKPGEDAFMAVNFNLCDPALLDDFRIRRFDGADSWEFID